MSDLFLPYASMALAALVSLLVAAKHPRAIQSWLFFAGLNALGAVVALDALSLRATSFEEFQSLHEAATLCRATLCSVWLAFSLHYARGAAPSRSPAWKLLLPTTASLPLVFAGWAIAAADAKGAAVRGASGLDYGFPGLACDVAIVIVIVILLMNIEATFRASVGTTRWRVKFVALGVATIFGAQTYTRSQALLFSGKPVNLAAVESSALLLGSILFAVAWMRGGFAPLQVYPSRSSMAQSMTVFLIGGYLFVVGALAQVVSLIGDAATFQTQAFLILIGIVCIGVLLLSDRLRLKVQHAFSRYFGRPFYDFRKVWALSSDRLSNQLDTENLCAAAARLIAETFNTLSVRVWLLDGARERLTLGASTAPTAEETALASFPVHAEELHALQPTETPFNLDLARGPLAEKLRQASTGQFRHGGGRLGVPLASNGRNLGLLVLNDRVSGTPYSPEETDLLRCVGAQLSATLLTLRVNGELMQAKELEAFQTMSAFFVHDLKNTVSTLNLMLQNLPVHFDNPEFRKDALRGIGNTVDRVNHLIARLSALRRKVELHPIETNLRELVEKALGQLNGLPGTRLTSDFPPVANVLVDPEHFSSVISNLLLNARDAAAVDPAIHIQIRENGGRVTINVADNGCGMTPEFIATSLFRPFSSTKNKGLGIGMFQCKFVIEAHRGTIEIQSAVGTGTTVSVSLPAISANLAVAESVK